MKISGKRKIGIALLSLVMGTCLVAGCSSAAVKGYESSKTGSTLTNLTNKKVSGTQYYGSFADVTENYASEFIMARNRPMAGTFYAYTEGITDDLAGINGGEGNEGVFHKGSQLVRLSYEDGSNEAVETVLIDSKEGVLRDPDVSPDGTKVVFSWKQNETQDDFHLYIYYLEDDYWEQITFGQGISDMEPKWLPNGKIVFSSARTIQIVDCWKTPVSNLYICNADGSGMIRVGYDQVHTTYPTVTEDGRVLYTRWDYNDRTQMFVQALFSMNSDGTGQTAVFGNNTNNPTTLMHTVGVPGTPNKYLTIVSGHHVVQGGKIAWIDTSVDRDGKPPVTYIHEKAEDGESFDTLGQSGTIYKYPYAINEYEMFYAKASSWASSKENTKFNYYYYNAKTDEEVCIANCDGNKIACSQIVPIRTRQIISRPDTVDYSKTTGTYYVANVYEGEQMANVEFGDVKYLRVVALDYRPYAVGSVSAGQNAGWYPDGYGTSDPSTPVGTANSTWDVKQVIGIVPVEADGSVMFECPSDKPVYFQLLNEDGLMIQSMRSWSTLMPGETFSCVGCHENKNNVPVSAGTVTLAMKKGVQELQKDLWMTTDDYEDYDPYEDYKGFSYAKEIQPILDNSCIVCHTDVAEANKRLGSSGTSVDYGEAVTSNSSWKYIITTKSADVGDWQSAEFDPAWSVGSNPFSGWGASEDAVFYATQKFTLTADQIQNGKIYVKWMYDEDPVLYINGTLAKDLNLGGKYNDSSYNDSFELTGALKNCLKVGQNVITVRAYNAVGGSLMDLSVTCKTGSSTPAEKTAVSLAGATEIRKASRDKVDYYLSYLVLTGSFLRGTYYVGVPSNNITNWIGGMSEPQSIPAYKYGSTKSNLVSMFLEGGSHHYMMTDGYTDPSTGKNYKITKEDLMRIAAWIDLGVPYRGAYDEASENWGSTEKAEAERRQNMRDYYTKIDQLNKAQLAGKWTNKKVQIEYFDKTGNLINAVESKHLAILYNDQKIQPGDKVVVTLPKGYEYIWFNLNPKMKLSLQYCPDGVFTYIVPNYAEMVLPNLTVGGGRYVYTHPTITAFLPTDEEIYGTTYNVALNPYDMPYDYATGNYFNYDENVDGKPMITTGSTWEGNSLGNFYPANAFDGITNNRGEGQGNMDQSWGPSLYQNNKQTGGAFENRDNLWLKVDFGREVELEYLVMYVRAYNLGSHDTWITSLEIEYDGGTIEWDLSDVNPTNQAQTLKLEEAIKTSYLKIKVTGTQKQTWFGITEFEAYGKNVAEK